MAWPKTDWSNNRVSGIVTCLSQFHYIEQTFDWQSAVVVILKLSIASQIMFSIISGSWCVLYVFDLIDKSEWAAKYRFGYVFRKV